MEQNIHRNLGYIAFWPVRMISLCIAAQQQIHKVLKCPPKLYPVRLDGNIIYIYMAQPCNPPHGHGPVCTLYVGGFVSDIVDMSLAYK